MEKFRRAVRMTMTKPERTRHLSADLDLARDAEADGLIGDLFEGTDGGDGDGSPRATSGTRGRPRRSRARRSSFGRTSRDRATRRSAASRRPRAAPPAGADAAPDATLVGPPAAGATFAVESNLDVLDLVLGDAGALLAFERFLDGEFAAEGLRFLAAAALHDGSRDDAARIVAAFVRADAASQVNLPQRIVADVERRLREDDLDGLFDDAVHECRALVANDNLQRFLDKAGADRGAALAPKRVRLVERLRTRRQLAAKPGRVRPPPPSPSVADLRAAAAPRPERPAARAPAAALLVHHLGLVAPSTTTAPSRWRGRRARRRRAEGLAAARAVEAAAARPPPVVLLDAPPGDAAFATFLALGGPTAPRASRSRRRRRGAGRGGPLGAARARRRRARAGRGRRRRGAPRSRRGMRSARRRGPRGRAPRARRALASRSARSRARAGDPPVSVYAALVQREAPRPVAVIPPGKAV
ncbi:tRNA-Phe hydroxylase [Aureococcus anophagefferens]|nr:tRNA-Phe hydroxylase [Aureococcus anophagefferens]